MPEVDIPWSVCAVSSSLEQRILSCCLHVLRSVVTMAAWDGDDYESGLHGRSSGHLWTAAASIGCPDVRNSDAPPRGLQAAAKRLHPVRAVRAWHREPYHGTVQTTGCAALRRDRQSIWKSADPRSTAHIPSHISLRDTVTASLSHKQAYTPSPVLSISHLSLPSCRASASLCSSPACSCRCL
jgi:hypothetical protein